MQKLSLARLGDIVIEDRFWNRYTRLVRETIIPYQWEVLNDRIPDIEISHSLANFKIAAGRETGEFYGVVFQDTDVAKWLEAVAFSLATHPDTELEERADEVIQIIGEAQQEDGYINTYFTIKEPSLRFSNLEEGHELYTAGHLMEAAVAYYKATGKLEFVEIMERFADLICNEFSQEKNKKGYPGHQEVEIGLIKLYEVTGKRKYIKQAKSFLDRRGEQPNYFLEEEKQPKFKRIFREFENYLPLYSQSHLPIREQKTAEGHAVRAMYMYCAMADVAYEYADKELMEVCKNLWNNVIEKRMYITGSVGSSGILERFTVDYDLPNDSNYSETCASIGLALFSRRMAQITRESKYIDIVEKALYNTLLSGIAQDGKSFFYVNPLEVWPNNCLPRTSMEHVKSTRQKWFGVACCPPNIARTLASLGEYLYFKDERRIWINLFVSNSTTFLFDGKEVLLHVKTDFPNDGNVLISIENKEVQEGTIAIRIPDYVGKYCIAINGKEVNQVPKEKGYAILNMGIGKQEVAINFDLRARIVHANPLVKEDVGKVAVVKGPMVFCMEEEDNESNLPAFFLDTKGELEEVYKDDLLGGTTVIKARGKKLVEANWNEGELYKEISPQFKESNLTFIPYAYWNNRIEGEMTVWVKELF
ncbi:MAG: glycoside hydrolase family 127 protein [Velocimicrobium sp.]